MTAVVTAIDHRQLSQGGKACTDSSRRNSFSASSPLSSTSSSDLSVLPSCPISGFSKEATIHRFGVFLLIAGVMIALAVNLLVGFFIAALGTMLIATSNSNHDDGIQ